MVDPLKPAPSSTPPSVPQTPLAGQGFETERVAVPVDKAGDPAHFALCRVCIEDLAVLAPLVAAQPGASQHHSLVVQVMRWFLRNWPVEGSFPAPIGQVMQFIKASVGQLQPGYAVPGQVATPTVRVCCFVCAGVDPQEWREAAESGFVVGFHCAQHAAAFHALVPTTWNCCDPPYHPAHDYAWRPRPQ